MHTETSQEGSCKSMKKWIHTVMLFLVCFVLILSGCGTNEEDHSQGTLTEAALSEELVQNNEEILFSFAIDEMPRYASLCRDENNDYIVFRFGTSKALTTEVFETRENKGNIFEYDHYFRGNIRPEFRIDDNHLVFEYDGLEFELFDTEAAGEDREVGLIVTNKAENRSETFTAVESTLIGNLLFFRYDYD